jgi:transcription antitermination factor NusG
MTSLRDLFKKSKKAYPKIKKKAQETTDKILDADLEETATKVVEATGKTTKKATIGLVKLIIWGVVIAIHVFVLYVVFEMIYNPIWCKGKKTEIFDNFIVFKSLNKREFRELEKQWFDKSCHYYVNPIGFSDEETEELANTSKYLHWKQTFRYQSERY